MLKFKEKIISNINKENIKENVELANALANEIRLKMLLALKHNTYSITGLANHLGIATSIIIFHMKVLEKVNLIKVIPSPQKNKSTLFLSNLTNNILFSLDNDNNKLTNKEFDLITYNMPVGNYSKIIDKVPKGGFSQTKFINLDEPYNTERFLLQNLYIGRGGYIEYTFPSMNTYEVEEISFSLEICSESPNYNNEYYSDITFWINNIELLMFTSPADFGGRRGQLNPSWLPDNISQYGQLINISINKQGTYFNGEKVNSIVLSDLKLKECSSLVFAFGNKKGCKNNGGFNLYGEKAGDYPQNILMKVLVKNN